MREATLHPEPPASVLLIDDRPAVLCELDAVLGPLNLNLAVASPGPSLDRALEATGYAAALPGVYAGGADPVATARRVRRQGAARLVPIIFLADAGVNDFTAAQAYTLGAVDYLVRPLVPEILRAKVANFVELYRQSELLRDLQRQAFERELARETQLRSEARFRHMADSAPVLLWQSDPSGLGAWFNRHWLEFTGRTLDQELGDGWAEGVHAEDRAHYLRVRREALAGLLPFRAEYRLRRADGEYRWVLESATALRERDGTFAGYLGSAVDITDRRGAEESLRRAGREKDRYLAMLAHELRNPLAPILTSLGQLERAGVTDPGAAEAVRRIDRRIRHLARLIDDLLDVSLLNSGGVELKKERLDVAQLVRTVAEDRRAVLDEAGLRLVVTTPPTPLWVAGDQIRLEQVFDNLLENAAKFTESGGTVSVVAGESPNRSAVELRVSDTGIGLGPEIAASLFDVFSQADSSLDRPRGGLGLGLALVRGVIERHGGTVTAASEGPGRGTNITVTLPAAGEPAALSNGSEETQAPEPRRRVLVVEDNRDAAASLSMLLELMGHEVRVATTGPEAVRLASEWPPEITISDIGLPGFDGYEVARRLRVQLGREPLLVALTGYGRDEDRRQSREAGFDHHLVKPADPAVLRRVLGEAK